jgi:hypothetical protein
MLIKCAFVGQKNFDNCSFLYSMYVSAQQVNITSMKEADVSHSISNPTHFLDTSY